MAAAAAFSGIDVPGFLSAFLAEKFAMCKGNLEKTSLKL